MPKGAYIRNGHAPNFRDLTGQRFGKRVILGWDSSPICRGKKGSSLWRVRCDCGKESVIPTSTIKTNPSCGCDISYTIRSGETRRSNIPEKIRHNHSHRKIFFKLSPEQFQEMIDKQNSRCKICEEVFTRTPHVDHDHSCCAGARSCGKCVRGLLCHSCNVGLGNLRDSIDLLEKAIRYLKNATLPQTNS